jgi:hypothetical protein
MATAHGKRGRIASCQQGRTLMTPEKLVTLTTTGLAYGRASPPDLRYVLPIVEGMFQGIAAARLTPDIALNIPRPRNRAWIVIIDDRAPGAVGPSSFDPATMGWLIADTNRVAVDSAAPGQDLCEYFVEEVVSGSRLLVVQTNEDRHAMCREFYQQRWRGSEIVEVVPVLNDPSRKLRAFVTRVSGRR